MLPRFSVGLIVGFNVVGLVGINYLSVGMLDHIAATHRLLFRGVSRVICCAQWLGESQNLVPYHLATPILL
jgi:hypothetical protein